MRPLNRGQLAVSKLSLHVTLTLLLRENWHDEDELEHAAGTEQLI